MVAQSNEESPWLHLVSAVRRNFKFDIKGLRVWLNGQGHLAADLPENWHPVWSDPRGKEQPEDWERRLGAAAHVTLPGHGWIMEGAAPSSAACKICGISTAIWLCYLAGAEAQKDLAHVTAFAAELGKIRSLVDQSRRRFAKASEEYRREHIVRIRDFLEHAKVAATSASGQGGEIAHYFEERLQDIEKGTTVRLMDNLGLDSMFEQLGGVLQGLQEDALVDTRNPGYAQPGVVARGQLVSLRTRVERCLLAVGFTREEIGEKLIQDLNDPLDAAGPSTAAHDERDRAEEVRDRVSPRRHPSNP